MIYYMVIYTFTVYVRYENARAYWNFVPMFANWELKRSLSKLHHFCQNHNFAYFI